MDKSVLEIDSTAANKHSGKAVVTNTISSSQEHSYIVTSLQQLLHEGTNNSVELTTDYFNSMITNAES